MAENFNVDQDRSIGLVRIFGGYFPDDLKPVDAFTVNFHEDDAGLPGVIINSQTAAASQTLTGLEVDGVQEYQIDIEIVQLSLTSGTYWVSVYNDTSPHTDSFGWETGDLDPVHGKPGVAYRSDLPGPGGWIFGEGFDLAITVLPPDPCPWDLDGDGNVGVPDLLELILNWGPCPGGDECKGQICPNDTFDCNPDDDTCVCYTLVDGSGFCGEDIPCIDLIPCDGDGDCPPRFRCAILTCCGDQSISIPECDGIPSANAPVGQRTSAGR